MRRPQKHQKKGPVAEVADAAAVDAALDRVAAVVDGADGPVDAAQLPTVYAAAHGSALDARALGFKKLGALLDVGAARGLWALERVPRRVVDARGGVASGSLRVARAGAAPRGPGAPAHDALLGFYHYASPAWSEAGRDATAAWLDALASALRLAGRVRVAAEGVNATLSGASRDVAAFVAALRAVPGDGWPGVEYKVEACGPGAAWPRLVVWTAEELCGFGAGAEERRALDAMGPGAALDPRAFHARLSDAGGARPPVLVDVRNGYETRVGGFRAAGLETLDPGTRTFADFAAWLDAPATREALGGRDVLMYCTGGVRCERATAALRTRLPEADRGRVFHLRGGIVRYLEAHGDGGHFVGANYVFDRRNRHGAAPRGSADVLGSCDGCAAPWDVYRGSHACASCAGKLLLCDACLSRPQAGRECEACRVEGVR